MRRRSIMGSVAMTLIAATLFAPASAATLRTHRDPNDYAFVGDIRRVSTDKAHGRVYILIGAWHRMDDRAVNYYVYLDTREGRRFDRTLHVDGQRGCTVSGSLSERIGHRPLRRLGPRTVACALPTHLFGIRKRVSYRVVIATEKEPVIDRAPDHRRYHRL